MRSVLVGIDDSDYSRAAVDLGLMWAREQNLILVGLGIVDLTDLAPAESVPLGASAFKVHRDVRAVEEARQTVERLLQQFSIRCSEAGVSSKILETEGTPVEQIARESHRVDLILMGQRTNFDLAGDAMMTEVLPELIKHCPRPVVTVPKTPPPGDSVVVAYDGSLQAARAVQLFQLSGLGAGKAIHVVSIDADNVRACQTADRAVGFLDSHGLNASAVAVSGGAPVESILDQVRKLNAGMLVIGAYGKPALREFFFGSVTRSLLAQSPVPTFIFA